MKEFLKSASAETRPAPWHVTLALAILSNCDVRVLVVVGDACDPPEDELLKCGERANSINELNVVG